VKGAVEVVPPGALVRVLLRWSLRGRADAQTVCVARKPKGFGIGLGEDLSAPGRAGPKEGRACGSQNPTWRAITSSSLAPGQLAVSSCAAAPERERACVK